MHYGESVDGVPQSVERALALLKSFTMEEPRRGVTELSVEHGVSKSAISKLLATLEAAGFVHQDPTTRKFGLGLEVLSLAQVVRARFALRERAWPHLHELRSETGETVLLTAFFAGEAIGVEYLHGNSFSSGRHAVGLRCPLYCTSVGKAILAFGPAELREQTLHSALPRYTPNTLVTAAALAADLERTEQRGYALDDMEHEWGIRCVGVPIWGDQNAVIGSMSVSAPAERMSDARCAELAIALQRASRVISRQMGAAPPRP